MKRTNPVAIVTGSGKRLGRQIAMALAINGYDIVVNYYNSKKGAHQTVKNVEKLGKKAIAVRADVSRKFQVDRMVRIAYHKFGRIDLLVNNSAIFVECDPLNISEKIWNNTINTNLKGSFICIQSVIPYMLKLKRGSIINIVSLGGIQAWKKHLPYSVSKAGLIMLTKCFAKILAPKIRVNAIAPGTILINGEESLSIHHVNKKNIPLKKYGTPLDITEAVTYLATKAKYMTGQILIIDGGRSIQ